MSRLLASTSPRLWFAFLGAPFAWSADELVGLAIRASTCSIHEPEDVATLFGMPLGPASLTVALLALGIVMLGVGITAMLAAYRLLRTTPDEVMTPESGALGRQHFMAQAGLFVGTLFTFGLVLRTITVLFTPPCGR